MRVCKLHISSMTLKYKPHFLATIFKFVEDKDQFLIYLDYLGLGCMYLYNFSTVSVLVPLRLLGEGS